MDSSLDHRRLQSFDEGSLFDCGSVDGSIDSIVPGLERAKPQTPRVSMPQGIPGRSSSDNRSSTIAMSLPAHTRRGMMAEKPNGAIGGHEGESSLLGKSVPVQIPRKLSSKKAPVGRGLGADFVPPHLLEQEEGGGADQDELFSPSSVKREMLLRRNEILRSTGFIEVKQFTGPTGELIDVVKEAAIAKNDAERKTKETGETKETKESGRPVKSIHASGLATSLVGARI
jgi:hypothetical protein